LALTLAAKTGFPSIASSSPAHLRWNPPPSTWLARTDGGMVWPRACRKNARSTASMQSPMGSSCATSLRESTSVSCTSACSSQSQSHC